MTGWSRLVSRLHELATDGTHLKGFQVTIVSDRTGAHFVAGGVDGLRRPLGEDTTSAMYCSAKSLLAVGAACLVEDGELSFDDRVGDIVEDCSPAVAATTIEELLSHRSGLVSPTLVEATTTGPEERLRAALHQPGADPPLAPGEAIYTEAAAWLVLGTVVSTLTGTNVEAFVTDRVIDPLGVGDHFDLAGTQADRRRIGVSLRGVRPMPLLLEQTDQFAYGTNPGYGGFATMTGLATLHQHLAGSRDAGSDVWGLSPEAVSRLISPGQLCWDRWLKKETSYSVGFATNLPVRGFTNMGPGAFGQFGLMAMVTVAADPDAGYGAAVNLNGLTTTDDIDWLRATIWPQIVEVATS